MYKVIKHFTDMQDNDYPYNVGDKYPREGIEVSQIRLCELSGSENRRGVPLIKKIPARQPEKPSEEKKDEAKNDLPDKL